MPGSREEDFLIEITHFHYMTYMAIDSSFVIIAPCPRVEKKICKEIPVHKFYTFTTKLPSLELEGLEIYNFCLTGATYQIWLRLALY